MKIVLETPRLFLREITVEDAESVYLLNHDPDVIKYTGDNAFESIEAAKSFINNYDQYKKYGFGRWAVIEKLTSNFIGWKKTVSI
jgi:ribosomal-protein-alanine N-acetyltransferase